MTGCMLAALLALVLPPGDARGLQTTTDAGSALQDSSMEDIYSESPCELHSLSAYKDVQGNIWGVGEGNLLWFNATNLSWSLLPLPNGTASARPWRVACGDPKKYIALVGKNASLVLHLPWQHWQFVDTDDVSLGYVDKDATWCLNGSLYGIDPLRETLYLLDPEEAHWTVRQDLPVMNNVNWSTPLGVVNTWVGLEDELILVERFGEYRHVMYTNSTGFSWIVLSEAKLGEDWPNLDKQVPSLAFNLGTERMWLWMDNNSGGVSLWAFEYNSTVWKRAGRKFIEQLPPLKSVLTAWEDKDKFCVLERSSTCNAQYTTSKTLCWSESDMVKCDPEENISDSQIQLTTSQTTDTTPKTGGTNYTSVSRVISPPTASLKITTSSSTSDEEQNTRAKLSSKSEWKSSKLSHDENLQKSTISITRAKLSPWHHTSVFGSVIFFGTSLSIFGVVGILWCVRKCVHFPKEALLLRDPPSVRYTAIPDSLTYDSRKPTPATYTVIPDAMA